MVDTVFWTAALTGASAIAGVLVTVIADGVKDRRRISHERRIRDEDRRATAAARRRTFELDNLITAYDGLWLLTRDAVKIHAIDRKTAQSTEHGYGGTLLPEGTEADLAETTQAVKAIRLILDDEVRRLALDAHSAMTDASMLGVEAAALQRGPVSLVEGDAMHAEVIAKAHAATTAISERIRLLMAEQ